MNLETIASPHTQESTKFFQNLLIFNWRIIALECCVGFCHTSTRISHRHTYVPSLCSLPPTSQPIPPLQVVPEPRFEFPRSYSKSPLAVGFTDGNVHVSTVLSPLVPPSPSHRHGEQTYGHDGAGRGSMGRRGWERLLKCFLVQCFISVL